MSAEALHFHIVDADCILSRTVFLGIVQMDAMHRVGSLPDAIEQKASHTHAKRSGYVKKTARIGIIELQNGANLISLENPNRIAK